MQATEGRVRRGPARAEAGRHPIADLYASKLTPPATRPVAVPRPRLVARLAERDHRIVAVSAPAGYGKSTLLAEWAGRRAGRAAWVSLDAGDNDPERLLAYTAAALDGVEPIDLERVRRSGTRRTSIAAVAAPRLAAAMSGMQRPVTLFFDCVEALDNPECLDVITELALHLPIGSQLALATRNAPPLPIARLRASGELCEIGAEDLAMDGAEARLLLVAAGIELDDSDTCELIARTEGWPVGIYLAALAVRAGGHEVDGLKFSGDDRLMADYLRAEFLDRLPDTHVEFLTRTSILDRMSGPVCDAVLQGSGSGAFLEELERSNALIVALDRRREWYRYHQLFRDLLRAELERREPALVQELHRRAAGWWGDHEAPEIAIQHAQRAGDVERVARLVFLQGQPAYAAGRAETVLRWLSWIEANGDFGRSPGPVVLAVMVFALTGRTTDIDGWAAAMDALPGDLPLPDGSPVEGWRAVARGYLAREGSARMHQDVRIAETMLAPASSMRVSALALSGLASWLDGDDDAAAGAFARLQDGAPPGRAAPASAYAAAAHACIAMERGEWSDARARVEHALRCTERYELEGYATTGLVFAAAARLALHDGRLVATKEYVARASALRPMLTYALPHVSVQILLELARVYAALTDAGGARAVLRQANDIMQHRPDLGVVQARADEIRERLETMGSDAIGASSLTAAELRLAPFLPTHLTFPQIGERLHVSRHTVKTQAISIYQKLGVSSRGEAIERLQEIGLIER